MKRSRSRSNIGQTKNIQYILCTGHQRDLLLIRSKIYIKGLGLSQWNWQKISERIEPTSHEQLAKFNVILYNKIKHI